MNDTLKNIPSEWEHAEKAVKIHAMMNDLYEEIENQKWLSIEQRDHLLNQLAVCIVQFEGIARWTIGEVFDG